MGYIDMVRSHVERLLERSFGVQGIEPDVDGDYMMTCGDATYFVSIVPLELPMVRVWAPLVGGVRRTAKLLTELNDINSRLLFGTLYWCHDAVTASAVITASSLDEPTLERVCLAVGHMAEDLGPVLAAVHGGDCLTDRTAAAGL